MVASQIKVVGTLQFSAVLGSVLCGGKVELVLPQPRPARIVLGIRKKLDALTGGEKRQARTFVFFLREIGVQNLRGTYAQLKTLLCQRMQWNQQERHE